MCKYRTFFLAFIVLTISLTGCSSMGVKPWERGNLAKTSMIFGSDSMIDTSNDHIYFSKEGTSGGRSFGAGGCGCN